MSQRRMPKEAVDEMHAILSSNPKASAEELEAVLKKHGVLSTIEQMESRDRKRRVQRFTARYRDKDGCRDVLAYLDKKLKKTFYLTIENCTDMLALEEIINRLNMNIHGLRISAKKAAYRRDVLLLRDNYVLTPRPAKSRVQRTSASSQDNPTSRTGAAISKFIAQQCNTAAKAR